MLMQGLRRQPLHPGSPAEGLFGPATARATLTRCLMAYQKSRSAAACASIIVLDDHRADEALEQTESNRSVTKPTACRRGQPSLAQAGLRWSDGRYSCSRSALEPATHHSPPTRPHRPVFSKACFYCCLRQFQKAVSLMAGPHPIMVTLWTVDLRGSGKCQRRQRVKVRLGRGDQEDSNVPVFATTVTMEPIAPSGRRGRRARSPRSRPRQRKGRRPAPGCPGRSRRRPGPVTRV